MVLTAAVVVAVAAPDALADQRECKVMHNALVCVVVHDPPPAAPSLGPSPGPGMCAWKGHEYPCNDKAFGWFDNQDGCYYKLISPQPPYDVKL